MSYIWNWQFCLVETKMKIKQFHLINCAFKNLISLIKKQETHMPYRLREQHFSTIKFIFFLGGGLINCFVWSRNGSKIVKYLFTLSEDCNRYCAMSCVQYLIKMQTGSHGNLKRTFVDNIGILKTTWAQHRIYNSILKTNNRQKF